jgi:nitrile hydratase
MHYPHDHDHDHDDHDHGPGHGHPHAHAPPQKDHDAGPMSAYEVLEEAVRELLIEKGVITPQEIAAQIDLMDSRSPALGAKVVARAWTDPAFKRRLLKDTRSALAAEFGIDIGTLADFRTVENTAKVHNIIVCTLCSCYPKMLLGIPPAWYKSLAYRSRTVVDPRGVLAEFGVELPDTVEVRVHDSTADLRYIVLPMRPKGTRGWSEAELAAIVTRDSMIGTAIPAVPPKRSARGARRKAA